MVASGLIVRVAGPVGDRVVGVDRSAGGDRIRAARHWARGRRRGGDGRRRLEATRAIAVDEAGVAGRQDRIRLAIDPGLVVDRDGQRGRGDRQVRRLRAALVVGVAAVDCRELVGAAADVQDRRAERHPVLAVDHDQRAGPDHIRRIDRAEIEDDRAGRGPVARDRGRHGRRLTVDGRGRRGRDDCGGRGRDHGRLASRHRGRRILVADSHRDRVAPGRGVGMRSVDREHARDAVVRDRGGRGLAVAPVDRCAVIGGRPGAGGIGEGGDEHAAGRDARGRRDGDTGGQDRRVGDDDRLGEADARRQAIGLQDRLGDRVLAPLLIRVRERERPGALGMEGRGLPVPPLHRHRPRAHPLDGERAEIDRGARHRDGVLDRCRGRQHGLDRERCDVHHGRGRAAVLVRDGERDRVRTGVARGEGERGAGTVGDRLSARADDVPVVGVHVVVERVEERARQRDDIPLVDRAIRARGDAEIGGLVQEGDRARAVEERILGQSCRDRVVARTGDDRVLARTGVQRVAQGRAAIRGERVEEQLIRAGRVLRVGVGGHLHIIRPRGGEGQVDDRGILVLERVVVERDDVAVGVINRQRRVERALGPVQHPREDLQVDQGAGLGGE